MPKKAKHTPQSSAANNEETPPLHKAAGDGDCAEVKRLLAKGADVNEQDAGGWTSLHVCVWTDHPATIDTLANGGADINLADESGEAPLHWAAILERPAAARTLIDKHRAKVNLRNCNGATPLHVAAEKNHYWVADVLIGRGADVDAPDNNNNTPLHYAARHGSARVVPYLINDANIGKENKNGETPLYVAQFCGNDDVADMLIHHADGGLDDLLAPTPKSTRVSERVYNKARGSVVWISVGANDNHKFVGSGVIIDDEFVVTNSHVIADAREIVIQTTEHRIEHGRVKIVANDSDKDICLLQVKDLEAPKARENPIKIRTYASLRVGEDVYAVGNPAGLVLSLSTGVISQKRDNGLGQREIQTDAATSGGSSGGGLFDRNGNLVGIMKDSVTGSDNPQNLNFAIPADCLLGYFA